MRKAIVITICFAVFYAGALWALEGCRAIGEAVASGHHSKIVSNQNHSDDGDSHHSHSDPAEVHCPNPLAAFVAAQRVSLERDRGWAANISALQISISGISNPSPRHHFALGPPGLGFSMTSQRFLLLSVFRI
jgi:hypothetical protein